MKKASYTIPCASRFRDSVVALAERRKVNAGDLARSVMLLVPMQEIDSFPDPGNPAADDRETVILKSGTAAGKPWQRKPRLQVRLPEGFDPVTIRKALSMALAMDTGATKLRLDDPAEARTMSGEMARLKAMIATLAFEPLPDGVETRAEALHVLGFPPGRTPGRELLRQRFRTLAAIHHPDSGIGDHQRMSQLNAAMDLLRADAA